MNDTDQRTPVAPASLVTHKIASMKTNRANQLFGGSIAAAQRNLEAQFASGTCFPVQIIVTNTNDLEAAGRRIRSQAASGASGSPHRARLLRLGCREGETHCNFLNSNEPPSGWPVLHRP